MNKVEILKICKDKQKASPDNAAKLAYHQIERIVTDHDTVEEVIAKIAEYKNLQLFVVRRVTPGRPYEVLEAAMLPIFIYDLFTTYLKRFLA